MALKDLPVHLYFQISVQSCIHQFEIGRAQGIFEHRVCFELSLSRCKLIIVHDDLTRFLDSSHHGDLLTTHEKSYVTEADIKKTAELVSVARIASTVIELQLAFAVLFDCKLARSHYIVSEEVLHGEESHLLILVLSSISCES